MPETDENQMPAKETFELDDSEHILNLDYYLHRSIIKWQDALESAIRQGTLQDGLTIRCLAANMVAGCATAKGLVHWEKVDISGDSEKNRKTIEKNNQEAEAFQAKLKKFEDELEKVKIDDRLKDVRVADFKVFEILKSINISATKTGKVIV